MGPDELARQWAGSKEPTFEAVEVGETFGPITVPVDDHYIKSGVFALDDDTPWYREADTPFGGRIAPSNIIARDLVALFCTRYDASRVVGLHQKEEVWFAAPVREGRTLTLTGTYVEKYERRGKGYVVLDCEARDDEGTLIVRQRSTEIMRIPDDVKLGAGSSGSGSTGERVSPVWPQDREPVARASVDLGPGTPVVPLTKTAWQDQMAVFSGCGRHWKNIHTEIAVAHKANMRTTLAQGMMETCWTSEMLARFFGPSWLSSGWIRMVYLQPVYENDRITCRAVVKDRKPDGDGTSLELEVWCENQDGLMTAAGWASGKIGE